MKELTKTKLEREEFIYWANWISMRWPNAKVGSSEIKSLYHDFSIYNDEIVGQAAVEQLDEGSEFFSWPKLKRRCKEIYNNLLLESIENAKTKKEKQELLRDKPGSLQAYLKQNGWKTIEEAMFYTRIRLFRENKLFEWDKDSMKDYVDLSYEEAKTKGWTLGMFSL
jgi:hypothetical protein